MTSDESWAMPSPPDSSICSGIDWLSCSAPRTDTVGPLFAAAAARLRVNERQGNIRKEWRRHGLSGWICGDTVAASSGQYDFASVSGGGATAAFPILFPLAANVSRLDVQLTATYPSGTVPGVAEKVYQARPHPGGGGRPPGRTLLRSTTGGATCYLGSRRSDVFGRVYDKGVERGSLAPGSSWRFEVELKGDVAWMTAHELAHVDSVEAEAAAIVCGRFSQWGVRFPWLASASLSSQIVDRDPDASTLLRWLQAGVSPTVGRLCSMGYAREVADALGLHLDSRFYPLRPQGD